MEIHTELVLPVRASRELSESLSKALVRNLTSFAITGAEATYLICRQLILELLHLRLCVVDDAFSHVHSFHTFLDKTPHKGLLHTPLATSCVCVTADISFPKLPTSVLLPTQDPS